ncbi:MAG: hypothetical protein ABIE74_00305 [Pseudomonadota bacterium]
MKKKKTMKRAILMVCILSMVMSPAAFAANAECLNGEGKFSKCMVYTKDGYLHVDYSSSKYKHLDRKIDGTKISEISKGEYARRRVGESVGLAFVNPLFLFMLFSKKKRDNFGVIYQTENEKSDSILFTTKKKYSPTIMTGLKAVSGKDIVEEVQSKKEGKSSEKK